MGFSAALAAEGDLFFLIQFSSRTLNSEPYVIIAAVQISYSGAYTAV